MTISTTTNRITYTGNGATVDFSFPYAFFSTSDLVVVSTVTATGVQTVLALTTDYTISGSVDTLGHYNNGGTVTAVTAPASTVTWTIYRDPSAVQSTDFVENDSLPAESLEASIDYQTMLIQRANDRIARTLQQPEGDSATIARIPGVVTRANKYLTFDSSGNPQATDGQAASGTSVTATGSTTARLLADRFADVINVKDFGAVGDGSTDDTAAFTAAAAVGLPIYVPATSTSYLTGSFTLDGVKMFGEGTLKWKTSADLTWITLDNGASLEGLSFDGNASVQSHAGPKGIFVSTSPSTSIDQCDFTNFRKYIIITDEDNGSMYGRVTNCRFHDSGTIANANAISICSSNWIVSGNHFEGGWGSDSHMVRTGNFTASTVPVENTVISGNFFTNTPYAGVVLELYSQHTSITGNTFDTMQQSIKMETAGSTVLYTAITGNTFQNITIATAFNFQGDYVVFAGNTVLNSTGGIDVGDYAVVSHNILENVGDATHASIECDSAFDEVTISGNLIRNAPFDGINVGGDRCTITGNRIVTAARRGISVSGDKQSVTGNYIEGVVDGLVINSGTSDSVFTGNVVLTASGSTYSFSKNDDFKTNYFDSASNVGFLGSIFSYTLATGAITIGRSDLFIAVDTEAAAATDDLDTITAANAYIGQIITLRSTSAARVVTAKDGTNLKLAGDFVMDATGDSLTLLWHGTFWQELARSSNA